MFGWIPVVVMLFAVLPPRRAVLAAFLVAWLFLPEATGYKIPMVPTYSKMTAATLGALLGVVIFDSPRLLAFRPQWIDLPILFWSAGKVGASVTNGYGVYDGLVSVEYLILIWGLPWFFGRIYFSDSEGIRELAYAVVLGGLVYVPLCLFEARMSPQLHTWVYGFHQHSWGDTKRFGGFRPTVFMQHGLMVGMWMCMTGLLAWWLWLTGSMRRFWLFSAGGCAGAILVTAVICKSFGAVALLALGMTALWLARSMKTVLPLWVLLLLAPAYMTVRVTGLWSGQGLVNLSSQVGNDERASSLECRLNSENQFIHAVWRRPVFGFRGWYNTIELWDADAGKAIPDALWMIEFTGSGFVGLGALTLFLLLPPAVLLWRLRPGELREPRTAAVVVLAIVCVLYMLDNLYNGMVNPIFALAAGAVGGWSGPVVGERSRVPARALGVRPVGMRV